MIKKFLLIITVGILTITNANSLSEEDLVDLAAKANTRAAVGLIYDYCSGEDAILQVLYSKKCKCAIRAGKAKNRAAVGLIADQCGL